MKLYCLSGHPTLPCNVLKFKSTTIMLDCGLDTTSVLNFLPLPLVHSPRLSKLPGWVSKDGTINLEKELKECAGRVFVDSQPEFCLPERELLDLSTIDVILISNYHCMMALPYITEHTGFTGTVYATEPTLQIGRLLMEELVNFMERVPKAQSATCWKNKEIQRMLPGPLKDAVDVWTWKRCYSMQEVNSALMTTRILSDTTLWLCRLFRYENGSAYFHEDDRDGLVKVCRLVINARYEEYASEGYAILSSKQPVIYQSASGRPGLGQHLCSQLGLPLSSLCTVPCNTIFGSQHQMDIALLDKLIKEDIEAGKLPLLLIANAGTPGAGHTDKLGRLKDLCDQYSMWLHVEGVNLATLALGQITSAIMAATKSDSMTLTPGQWLGLPAVTAVTLYRHEDPALSLAAGLTSSQPVAKLRALPLWLSLQYLGHNGIVEKIRHATALSQQLLQKLKALTSIKTSVEDELSSPVVLFKFSQESSAASSGGSVEGYCTGEKEVLDSFNRWLGEQLVQLVPTSGVDVVELEDEGTCVRFSPLLTAAVLGTQQENVEELVEKLSELVPLMCSTMCLRQDFREEIHRHSPSLRYIEDLSWPGLGVVRYEPQAEGMDESRRKQELEKINTELLKKLQDLDTDIIFSTGPEFGTEEDCIFVGMVTEDVDVTELVDTVAALGRDIEESGRLLENMTEVVRKGILEAELQLQKANEEKLIEEGMLRQIPLVGSVLNWFSPFESSIKGRTFNLAAGSLDSTETTYSTKAQAGRPNLQETPTSSSKKLPGQRLFRRSGVGSDSFSETSSIGQAEETTRDGSIHPPTSPPIPKEDSHTACDVTPEKIQESSVQEHSQVEDEVASEERQPEGPEVEQSER